MNDRRYPWVILVPAVPDISEIHQLDADQRHHLMEEVVAVSQALTDLFQPDKINVGALGNLVPQLHIHVIARFRSDSTWPDPVWGRGSAEAYDPDAFAKCASALAERLAGGD